MYVKQVKDTVKEWINAHVESFPGLRGAHLVGGITTMQEEALFPAYKDVDMHLIFEEGSSHLSPKGPIPNALETEHEGLMLEGGFKAIREYESAEVILANPEIAHHLTVNSILYDPNELLRALSVQVTRDYARRQWVMARLEYEHRGIQSIYERRAMAVKMFGPQGQIQLLAQSFVYTTCALCVAVLQPPTSGSRTFPKMQELLSEHGHAKLYAAMLDLFNLNQVKVETVSRLLDEGSEAFDLAAQVLKTPHFFQFKFKPHLKPYFTESCRRLLGEGHPQGAMLWLLPFYVSACQIIIADGSAEDQSKFASRLQGFFSEVGFHTAELANSKWEKGQKLHSEFFKVAEEIVMKNPNIIH
jgi:hypothetical protein